MFITFDHNLLIDLENDNGATGETLRQLVSFHDLGQITLRVSAIGASERLKGKTYAPNFMAFQERVRRLSQREIEILKPLGYWGITYWDWCVWGGDGTPESELEQRIHSVLFPKTEFKWQNYAQAKGIDPNQPTQAHNPEFQKWRNHKCDVLTMWCHIQYKGDIFVTPDKHFYQVTKRPALISLGARSILYPSDAVTFVNW